MVLVRNSIIDDSSISSTLTVDRQTKALTATASHCRGVHFDMTATVEHENHDMCQEDCATLWYQHDDYRLFKHANVAAAKAIVHAESKSKAPFSYTRVFERTYELCKHATDETQEFYQLSTVDERHHLQRWYKIASSRVGMERIAVRSIAREKGFRRREVVDVVMDIQDMEEQLERNVNVEEMMRKASQRVSRPSRVFAAAVAEAHATVIRKDSAEAAFFA